MASYVIIRVNKFAIAEGQLLWSTANHLIAFAPQSDFKRLGTEFVNPSIENFRIEVAVGEFCFNFSPLLNISIVGD